jgi:peptide/nickel transport system substrate-binding protein
MRALGYGPEAPLRAEILSNTITSYSDMANWSASALKDVYIDAKVRLVDSGVSHGYFARRDFSIVAYTALSAADDPDMTFYEHYGCASQRNYSDYCKPEVQRLIDQQSEVADTAKRRELVQQIDEILISDVARVLFGFRTNYSARWPYVKNYVPHQAPYNFHRLQEVWLDR